MAVEVTLMARCVIDLYRIEWPKEQHILNCRRTDFGCGHSFGDFTDLLVTLNLAGRELEIMTVSLLLHAAFFSVSAA